MAGSDGFSRTESFQGPSEKEGGKFIHVALAYDGDGTIRAYRNGVPYGEAYKSNGPLNHPAGQSQILFGLRHGAGIGAYGAPRFIRPDVPDLPEADLQAGILLVIDLPLNSANGLDFPDDLAIA